MNRTEAPAHCSLLTLQYVCYFLNHISTASLGGQVPLQVLVGVTQDTSIMLLYTFYQPVFYATHDQHSLLKVKREQHFGWVLQNIVVIIHRSAIRPRTLKSPNKRFVDDGGEEDYQPNTNAPEHPTSCPDDVSTVFIKSQHDDGPTSSKPMPEFNPDDLVGRTFLLPLETMGRD